MMVPVLLVVGSVFLGLGYWAYVLWRKQAEPAPPKRKPESTEERVRRLDREAQQHVAAGNLEAGRRMFLEAGRPGKAAQVAVREGNLELAGQLFERARLYEKALVAFNKAGNREKVAELQKLIEQRGLPRTVTISGELPVARPSAAPNTKSAEARPNDPDDEGASGVQLLPGLPGTNQRAAEKTAGSAHEPLLELPPVAKSSTAWLLEEDELLDLPRVEQPAFADPPADGPGKRALGALSLVKAKKAVGIVEDASDVKRSRKDER